jgi:hypothetical protein
LVVIASTILLAGTAAASLLPLPLIRGVGDPPVSDSLRATDLGVAGVTAMALRASGQLYFSCMWNHICALDDTTNRVVTVSLPCQPTAATSNAYTISDTCFSNISSLLFDHEGGLLVAEPDSSRVRIVDPTTGLVSAFAGTGTYGYMGDGGRADEA